MISSIEKRVTDEDNAIKNSESHIERLNQLMEDIKQHVEEEKFSINPLMQKSKELEKRMADLQKSIVKKLAEKEKNDGNIESMTKKVNDFFEKKLAVVNLVDKVNKDRDELEKSLIELIKKAKSFQLSARGKDIGKEMVDLEKKFDEVDKKKGTFEEELKKLGSFFKI